jgi:hypothetical protein
VRQILNTCHSSTLLVITIHFTVDPPPFSSSSSSSALWPCQSSARCMCSYLRVVHAGQPDLSCYKEEERPTILYEPKRDMWLIGLSESSISRYPTIIDWYTAGWHIRYFIAGSTRLSLLISFKSFLTCLAAYCKIEDHFYRTANAQCSCLPIIIHGKRSVLGYGKPAQYFLTSARSLPKPILPHPVASQSPLGPRPSASPLLLMTRSNCRLDNCFRGS